MEIITLPLGPLQTNCYIVYDEASRVCALIDPGAEPQKIMGTLTGLALNLKGILLTHAHYDHTGALHALHERYPEVPIYVGAPDTDETTNMSRGNLVYTDTFLDGDDIACAPLSFHAISTPGHTLGSSCLISQDVIFSGDTLFAGSCGRTDLPGGNGRQMMASLKRLAERPGDYRVLPGHGEASTLDAERQTNYYMREAMRV